MMKRFFLIFLLGLGIGGCDFSFKSVEEVEDVFVQDTENLLIAEELPVFDDDIKNRENLNEKLENLCINEKSEKCEKQKILDKNNSEKDLEDSKNKLDNQKKVKKIVFMSPKNGANNIKGRVPLTFLWGKPTFKLANVQKVQKFLNENIEIIPAIEGSWKLIGSRGISFQPKVEWQVSTKYLVKFSDKISRDFVYSFETEAVKLQHFEANNLINKKSIILNFNQEVDLKKLQKLLKLSVDDKEIGTADLDFGLQYLSIKKNCEKNIDVNLSSECVDEFIVDKKSVELMPKNNWQIGRIHYNLKIKKGNYSLVGNIESEEFQRYFSTIDDFEVREIKSPYDYTAMVEIKFSSEVNFEEFINHLEISRINLKDKSLKSEKIVGDVWQKYKARLKKYYKRNLGKNQSLGERIYYTLLSLDEDGWDPKFEYLISIKPGLKDVYNRILEDREVNYLSFKPKISNKFEKIFMPEEQAVYSRNVDLRPTFIYAGLINGVNVSLEKLDKDLDKNENKKIGEDWEEKKLPPINKNYQTKFIKLEIDKTKINKIFEINLAEEFTNFYDDNHKILPGKYRLEIKPNYIAENEDKDVWAPKFSREFYISDFFVELQEDAWGNFTGIVTGENYKKDKNFNVDIFVGDWDNTWLQDSLVSEDGRFEFNVPNNLHLKYVRVKNGDMENGGKIGFGSADFNNGIGAWNVGGNYNASQYRDLKKVGTIFTERPLYKKGDQVFVKGFLRNLKLSGKNQPLKMVEKNEEVRYDVKIFSPEWEVLDEINDLVSFEGSFDFDWHIPEDAMLGNYTIEVMIKSDKISEFGHRDITLQTSFWLAEYRKPKFFIKSKFSRDLAFLKQDLDFEIDGQYFFGGGLSGREVDYTVTLFGQEEGDWWYWNTEKKDKVIAKGQAILDENGYLKLPIDLKKLDLKDHKIDWNLITVNAEVKISEGEIESVEKSIPFYQSDLELELKNSRYFYEAESTAEILGELKTKSTNKKVKNTKLQVRMMQTKWVRNDRKNADGNFYGEWESVEDEVWKKDLQIDENGQFKFETTFDKMGGEFFFEFKAVDKNGVEFVTKRSFWVAGKNQNEVRINDQNKRLYLFANHDEYQIGDEVAVFVANPNLEITKAHVMLTRGEVLEELDFNMEQNTVNFKAEKWMSPNVYLTVLLEGKDEYGDWQVRLGNLNILVEDPSHELNLNVEVSKALINNEDDEVETQKIVNNFRPGDEVSLKINADVLGQGVETEVVIAVVDESLLALKSREKIDLKRQFIQQLSLGVRSFHTLANYVSDREVQAILADIEKVKARMSLGFGGGGGGKGEEFSPRGDFRDTAEFFAKVLTDENGQAEVKFKLPDNLTTWNVWVVGATKNNAFGDIETDFKVSLPLLVSEIMPNYFQANDEVEIGVLVRNTEYQESIKEGGNKTQQVRVLVKLPTEITYVGQNEAVKYDKKNNIVVQNINLEQEARVFFKVKVGMVEALKSREILFKVEGENYEDGKKLVRNIFPPQMSVVMADLLRVKGQEVLEISPDKTALFSKLVLKVYLSLADRLKNLIDITNRMNYGCAEQRLSKSSAVLFQKEFDEIMGRKTAEISLKELTENRDYIESSFKNNGYGYWKNSRKPAFWLTVQVVEMADLWAKAGVGFNEKHLKMARNWLKNEMDQRCFVDERGIGHHCYSNIARMHAAYVLSQYGDLSVNDLGVLMQFIENGQETRIWWLRTLANFDEVSPKIKEKSAQIYEQLKEDLQVMDQYAFLTETSRSFFSQDERLTALFLELLLENNELEPLYPQIVRYLTDTGNKRLSGNSAMRILKVLGKYASKHEVNNLGAKFVLKNETMDFEVSKKLARIEQVEKFELKNLPKKDQKIEFKVEDNKAAYVEVEMKEVLPIENVLENSRGLWIERKIFELDDKEFKNPVTDLKIGKNYIVNVDILTTRNHRQLMLEVPIVAGAEIVNFDLDNVDHRLEDSLSNAGSCKYGWCGNIYQHKEFFHDKARFFIDRLSPGTHRVSFLIRTRIKGNYDLWPAKIEEMYYPEIFANTTGEGVVVE
jgi:uncharacterized protein YfaS (alpha-2-macroglobulin family)